MKINTLHPHSTHYDSNGNDSITENQKITVITVSFNAVSDIERTILSVINQSYFDIEYLVIDGGSTDGTVNIIEKYNDRITAWLSESDKGVYDAMNKGIRMATGRWILFMNSGDTFHDNKVVEDIFKETYPDHVGVIWGDTDFYNKEHFVSKSVKTPFTKTIMPYRTGMGITHQSMFTRTYLAKN